MTNQTGQDSERQATLEMIRAGKSLRAIVASWEPARLEFLKRRAPFLLYAP